MILGKSNKISVAICADINIKIGVHVTLFTLLKHSSSYVNIYFIQKGYTSKEIDRIHQTLRDFDGNYELITKEFDDNMFSKLRGLHGNKYAFTRMFLANIIDEERIIYLDSDLAITKDLYELFHTNLGDKVIGVSGIGKLGSSLEHNFFNSLGFSEDDKYFNSGVILMDLSKWRSQKLTEKCLEFANKHSDKLLTADQTVLNCIFHNDFLELDKSYNVALYPKSNPINVTSNNTIFHFVGSPKPWDFLGELIHSNYNFYKYFLKKTSYKNYKTYLDFSLRRLNRTIRLSRAYFEYLVK